MKKITFLPFLLLLVIGSCNNSSGSGISSASADSNSITAPPSAGGTKGTITCVIDDQQRTFKVQQNFFEIPLGVDVNGPKDGLEILNGDTKKEGFQFEFKKSGTTKIKGDATGDINCIINYYNPHGITYTGDDVTIVVTSYDHHHLTGTFSGKLVNVYYEEGTNGAKNYPQYIQVTDGKFDF